MKDNIEVCVFDAYGTLFDVSSVTRAIQDEVGESWQQLSELWRSKQLQYTWLRGLAGRHADFSTVTEEALRYAMNAYGLVDRALEARLMSQYLQIAAYPDARQTLQVLRDRGMRTAILSNGTPQMLDSAVRNAGLAPLLDKVLSVEQVGVFKPHPAVYQLACDTFGVKAGQVCFVSSNGWDAFSAKAFGFNVVWCNRQRQPAERIPEMPDAQIEELLELPGVLG